MYTLDDIKSAFRGENGSGYSGPQPEYAGSMILFDTEANFTNATIGLLVDYTSSLYADSYMSHQDMGKNIYIGVKGGESRMLTMSLLRLQGTDTTAYGLTAVNVSAGVYSYYDGDVDIDLIRGAA